jgi:EAL domain-containing protein (putative c-di-GMP-specific phosphodiesterase class I)
MTGKAVLHEAIRDAANPMAVLDRIVRQSLDLVPRADGASLEIRRDSELLEYVSAAGTLADYVGLTLPVHHSLSGMAVLTGEVQRCDDGRTDPRTNPEAVARTGVISMVCVPLSSEQGGVAVLKVSAREPNAFTDEDVERLRILAQFLDTTVSAASDLARVTAEVLTELDVEATEQPVAGAEADVARFVANIMTPGLVDKIEAEQLIREVMEQDRLEIVLQPIVDLASGDIVSCEALTRFHGGVDRSPEWWFASAHVAGIGDELELIALRKALAAFAEIPAPVRMAVNVGPSLAMREHFADVFDEAPLDRLTVELTEHEAVADYDTLLERLTVLRRRGVRLSVDDTGSGYSGLSHILRLQPDVLKLDRELVTEVHRDPVKRALATALVAFARSLGARVVAEGIEQEDEAHCLQSLGVDYGQGFLFARAMPPQELSRRLADLSRRTDG